MTDPVTVTEDGNYLVRDIAPCDTPHWPDRDRMEWSTVALRWGYPPIDVDGPRLTPADARQLAAELLSAADRVDGHRAHNPTQEDPCPSSTTSTGPTSTEHS